MTEEAQIRIARDVATQIVRVVRDVGEARFDVDDKVILDRIFPILDRAVVHLAGKAVVRSDWLPDEKVRARDIGPQVWLDDHDEYRFSRRLWQGRKALGLARMEYALCELLWLSDPEPLSTGHLASSLPLSSEPGSQRGQEWNAAARFAEGKDLMSPRSVPVVLRRLAANGITVNRHAGKTREGEWSLTERGRERFAWVERETNHRRPK